MVCRSLATGIALVVGMLSSAACGGERASEPPAAPKEPASAPAPALAPAVPPAPAPVAAAPAPVPPAITEPTLEGAEVPLRNLNRAELKLLLGATPGEPGAAFAGLTFGMLAADAMAVPAIARWLAGQAPVPGRLVLRFSAGRLSEILVELRGEVAALARAQWPEPLRAIDGLPVSRRHVIWRGQTARAIVDDGEDEDPASWKLRLGTYQGERIDEVLRPDRLPLGVETIRVLGATRAELRAAFGAHFLETPVRAVVSFPPPLFSQYDALELGVGFDGDRAVVMCAEIDYGLFQPSPRGASEIVRRLQAKFGPSFKPLCADSSDFAHRDITGTTEHCIPRVSFNLSLGPRTNRTAPPSSC